MAVPGGLFRRRDGHPVAQLSPRRVGDSAPADEVGDARHHSCRSRRSRSSTSSRTCSAAVPGLGMKVSVLSLVFLPLTFGYAIFRYRLMDVDLIFKRGMAYTIAAGAITGSLLRRRRHGVGAVPPELPQHRTDRPDRRHRRHRAAVRSVQELDPGVPRQVLLSQALRLPQDADRVWTRPELRDRSRQDAAARSSIACRARCWSIASPSSSPMPSSPSSSPWRSRTASPTPARSIFDFLHVERPEWQAGHLFFDNTNQAVRETPPARETIRRLDLNYYIPCTVMNRIIAVLGLGKTTEGDFLSSEDVELLETLAGYIGIAVQNARLYKSLEAEGRPVRAAEGVQREHRRVDQRRRAGGRSGRPHRVVELADGSDVRAAARRSPRPAADRRSPTGVPGRVLPRPADAGHSQSVQVPAGHDGRRDARHEHRDCSAGQQRASA